MGIIPPFLDLAFHGGSLSPLISLMLLHRRSGFGGAKEVAAGRFVAVGHPSNMYTVQYCLFTESQVGEDENILKYYWSVF